MSEYRQIANLQGPPGRDAFLSATRIYTGTPLDDYELGLNFLSHANASQDIGLPVTRLGSVEIFFSAGDRKRARFTASYQEGLPSYVFQCGQDASGVWSAWEQIYPADPNASSEAAERIKDLARRDGWAAVYDPTDPTTTQVDDEGFVRVILDGLGNFNGLVGFSESFAPTLIEGEFGQLAGMSGGRVHGYYGTTLSQPVTVLLLARDGKPTVDGTSERRGLMGARASIGHQVFMTGASGPPEYQTNGGLNGVRTYRRESKAHLIRATFHHQEDAPFTINGDFVSETRGAGSTNGIGLGAHSDGSNLWVGSYGLALVYAGEISQEKVDRMSRLVMSLAGIPDRGPRFDATTEAYSEDQYGEETLYHGSPNEVHTRQTIASLTKVMTLWVARKHLSDADMSTIVTIEDADDRSSSRIHPGDEVSMQDLFYLAAMPSDNTAPRTIARVVGQKILDGEGASGGAESRFIQEMNQEAENLGYSNAEFINPQFGALMTPKQLVDLFRRSMADPVLRDSHQLEERTITVTNNGIPRDVQVPHTFMVNSPFSLPGVIAGKTGTNYGWGHLVAYWTGPDGIEHYTAILNAPSAMASRRYRELRKVMMATG